MNSLPLTPNGKVDRAMLPLPEKVRQDVGSKSEFIAPRTDFEEMLAEIWRELLNVEKISVHDNFFEIGGHSLLLTQLASRIRKVFDIEIPLRTLFDVPTIEDMTTAIAAYQIEQEDPDIVARMIEEL
jgi:acyl carrier protein